ncbi:MAG: methylenetetrahydrofolate--tRNA-(uracil(54)-C(5))-methyltransferase (FADH(2)-oxidizing) TrmFO [Thermovirgaceae bacterium]|nr:methylenetetrahydrofolate--tRNA-(uracil(54)-C(5))-methyltransferase (FADH(2)-oxidizing) TrmFO [Thermovirgaceae bacterium]
MNPDLPSITVVGAGLAGCEAAWQIARRGVRVTLVEMRPEKNTPAHRTASFAELVCSNSLGADVLTSPGGILKAELDALGSLILACAHASRIPAGRALAVDRDHFSSCVTRTLTEDPLVAIERREVRSIPEGPAIIATGPLTSGSMAGALSKLVGEDFLSFFDAVSPVVTAGSIDMSRAFRGGRYGVGDDYINCPMSRVEYEAFQEALSLAERAPRHDFEKDDRFFEGCLPVEVIASRGADTLRFGPLRPVGLEDPLTGERAWAVVQLRQENSEGTLFNLVGFQTNLKWPEQERVFRMIPALQNAEIVRFGVMHRNIYVNAPRVLDPFLRIRGRENLFLAGQITGVEGYIESTAMGAAAALNAVALLQGLGMPSWPRETAIGSLLNHLSDPQPRFFQPMNVNLGLFPPLPERIKKKTERCERHARRSSEAMKVFLDNLPPLLKNIPTKQISSENCG